MLSSVVGWQIFGHQLSISWSESKRQRRNQKQSVFKEAIGPALHAPFPPVPEVRKVWQEIQLWDGVQQLRLVGISRHQQDFGVGEHIPELPSANPQVIGRVIQEEHRS